MADAPPTMAGFREILARPVTVDGKRPAVPQTPRARISLEQYTKAPVTVVSQVRRRSARRSFIVSPYRPGPEGQMLAEIPTRCPEGAEESTECAIGRKDRRKRKTGPGFPLAVMSCKTHEACFTLYPPGYAPFLRAPVVRLAPDGSAILDEDAKALRGTKSFEGTAFQAVVDAMQGRAWARNSAAGVPDRWWSTQGRQITAALRLTGICPSTDERLEAELALILGVPQIFLRQEARRPKPGYRERGEAAWRILRRVPRGRSRALRLLACGCRIGRWGEPWVWEPRRRSLERTPFRFDRTAAPP